MNLVAQDVRMNGSDTSVFCLFVLSHLHDVAHHCGVNGE